MEYYIIFGPPGAGKGTQSSLLVEKFKFRHVSTGQLLRDEIKRGSEIGVIAKGLIESGQYVSDSIVLQMVKDLINSAGPSVKGFIFDGFPRTICQAESFDKMLREERGEEINGVLSLEVDDEIIVSRIRKRAEVEGRKDDSSLNTVLDRISTYHEKTEPLKEYYIRRGKFFAIDGGVTVNEIFNNICKVMESIGNE